MMWAMHHRAGRFQITKCHPMVLSGGTVSVTPPPLVEAMVNDQKLMEPVLLGQGVLRMRYTVHVTLGKTWCT